MDMSKDKASQEDIYRAMRKDIELGTYPASSRLPSVRTLAKRFNASPNTISKVVSRLMESGLCSARRGVGLFVRSLPSRKVTLLYGRTDVKPNDGLEGFLENQLAEKLKMTGVEIERLHITPDDPPYGPAVERIRKPGRVILTLSCSHEPYLKAISDLRRPLLVVGHAPNRCTASSVVVNSFKAGYLAARHLIKNGRRNIAFIGRVRQIRQVKLPESESLKELAGIQCAFMEEGMALNQDFIFGDFDDVGPRIDRLRADKQTLPDAAVMPWEEGINAIQALKALGKVDHVVIGDDSILAIPRHPTAVCFRRDEMVELIMAEMTRLLGEQKQGDRNLTVECELYPEKG
jgi:DNA-binding transcriptional regulator YhcF (GntR family)